MLHDRARIIRRVRSFFDSRDYLELDTPLLSPDLIPESCLEVFQTMRVLPSGKTKPYWLVPSPEIWMKKAIARHKTSVYQICKCFRNGESSGHLHSPEFTMLEYYTMEAGYLDSLELTERMFAFLADDFAESRENQFWLEDGCGGMFFSISAGRYGVEPRMGGNGRPACRAGVRGACPPPEKLISVAESGLRPPFTRLTVAEAFARHAGFDLFAEAEREGGLESQARRLGLEPQPGTETAVLYDLIFIHAVEPALRSYGPVALLDYPAFVPCLAKLGADARTVERWELYYNGIELANCFSEETDSGRVRSFFESEAAAKSESALVRHDVDADYWKLFSGGFPRCSGVALGLDRLMMALLGRSTVDAVLPFPME